MEKQYYKDYFIFETRHWFFVVRRKILLYFIGKYTGSGHSLLDFGCGSGYLVAQLQKNGYDAHGIDFERDAINFGLASGTKNLAVANGEYIDFPDNSLDIITAFDVLEHVRVEQPIIAEFIRVLRPGGKILLTVPAYLWLWGIQDEVSHHYRRYTLGSLIKIVGVFPQLTVIKKTYFNTILFPAIAFVRLTSKWLGIRSRESDFDINNNFLNTVFYFIFNAEFRLLKFVSFPFGVSILIVLEKKMS